MDRKLKISFFLTLLFKHANFVLKAESAWKSIYRSAWPQIKSYQQKKQVYSLRECFTEKKCVMPCIKITSIIQAFESEKQDAYKPFCLNYPNHQKIIWINSAKIIRPPQVRNQKEIWFAIEKNGIYCAIFLRTNSESLFEKIQAAYLQETKINVLANPQGEYSEYNSLLEGLQLEATDKQDLIN